MAAAHPSDEEPATASDSSSGADPWTVVTSPSRRTAPSLPAAVLESAPAAPAQLDPTGPAEEQPALDLPQKGTTADESVAPTTAAGRDAEQPAAEQVKQAEDDSAAPSLVAAPQQSAVAVATATADAEPVAHAAQQSAPDNDDDDDEAFDDTMDDVEAAPDDGGEDVDEDWGYESA